MENQHKHTNELIHESSPYLLQHAHNPVDWYPWSDEALEKAKKENKLLIISIGYAACHWCHVMEHESFEDSLVAKVMNDNFVCIKVDREERPDVDDVYMTACQLASGRGCGWPLNAFALPDGRPVWAGTYFPKEQWVNILNQFKKLKEEQYEKLEESADKITKGIENFETFNVVEGEHDFTIETIQQIGNNFLRNIDFEEGGRKGAPKFPMPNNYEFLLQYYYLTKDQKALEAVTTTLDKMAYGGIYDQLGGGFARYSVDSIWLVPHFEKMLYDNGQLVSVYSNAYKVTHNPEYQRIVEETTAFVERELMNQQYGFYSSLDADSEGEEGKFYVWSQAEIDSILTPDESNLINTHYSVSQRGNWEHTNILNVNKSITPGDLNMTDDEFNYILTRAKEKLFAHRSKRIRPGLDDKILTSWNALMLKGYIDAYKAFGDDHYLEIALKNADFLITNALRKDGGLNRNFKDGKSSINGFLDDYATLIDAFTALYEVTFDEDWLVRAKDLTDYVFEHFYNKDQKMFYYTSNLDPALVARKMELSDNVISSSNSIMARNLHKLGTLTTNEDWIQASEQMLKNMQEQFVAIAQPNFYSNWCQLYASFISSPYEVAVLGEDANTKALALQKKYLPNSYFLGGKTEGSLELLKDKLQEDRTMIYVCQNKVCKLPVEDVERAVDLIIN